MKTKNITTPIISAQYPELTPSQQLLVDKARQATHRSYAPYSHFSVGAAILLSDGTIVTGANQENAAFPSSTCAERSACYYAGANYPEAKFEKIAIAARGTDGNEPATTHPSLRSMPPGSPRIRETRRTPRRGNPHRHRRNLHPPLRSLPPPPLLLRILTKRKKKKRIEKE